MTAPRPPGDPILAITFLYYRNLPAALKFYTGVMGFPLAIDQGWSKILRVAGCAHVGLVDERRGMHRAVDQKPVQLCIRVRDVDGWHGYISGQQATKLSPVCDNDALGIRAFTFCDPEGYQIEVQSAIQEGVQ